MKTIKGSSNKMTNKQAILQLQNLREHCNSFRAIEGIWEDDMEALDLAIQALKQTPKNAIETISKHCSRYNVEECDKGKCGIKDWCRRLEEDRPPEDWEA